MPYKVLVWIGVVIIVITIVTVTAGLIFSGLLTFPTLHIGRLNVPIPHLEARALQLLDITLRAMAEPIKMFASFLQITFDQFIATFSIP
jgi:hypothetical protein